MARFQALFAGRDSHAHTVEAGKSTMYQPTRVCELCYSLYQSELQLEQSASQLARAMAVHGQHTGLPIDASVDDDTSHHKNSHHHQHSSTGRAMNSTFGSDFSGIIIRCSSAAVGGSVALLRLLVYSTPCMTCPMPYLTPREGHAPYEYALRYKICGRTTEVPW